MRRRRLLAAATAAAVAAVSPAVAQAGRRTLVASDGARLSVLDSGAAAPGSALADRPTIVLVPGWCMPATIWQAQIDALGARFRVVALDPRGQGDSEITVRGYTAERRAADIAELLAGLPRVVLVGWSLAVLEALQMIDSYGAQRLDALMLVDNSIGEPPAPQPSDFVARLRADRRATLERFVRGLFARPRSDQQIGALLDGALRMPLDASIQLLSYPFPREHWRSIARALRVPLAYVVTPRLAPQAASLAAHRPGSRIEVFEQSGHALFVDQPERFNALLAQFAENPRASAEHAS